jgi:hypothetical protein
MKKVLLLSLFTIVTIAFSAQKTQAQEYEQGSLVANVGVGLGGGLGLPISASVDYGFKEKISLGGFIGFSTEKEDLILFKARYTYFLIGARAAYHFDLGVDKLDPYAGAMLGYNAASLTLDPDPGPPFNNIAAGGGVILGGFVGARYYVTDNIGAFAELGYGLGLATVGVAYKF